MLFLYLVILVVLGVGGCTVYKMLTTVNELTAPQDEKQNKEFKRMKSLLKKTEENHQFLKNRFTVDFSGPGNVGNEQIEKMLLDAKKQLMCANFNLSAYTKHLDADFCKELSESFDRHVIAATRILNNVSKIWTEEL